MQEVFVSAAQENFDSLRVMVDSEKLLFRLLFVAPAKYNLLYIP